MSDQEVLDWIDEITSDDFCVELEMRAELPGGKRMTADLRQAYQKLSLIYRLAHSHNRSNTCYAVHTDWRKLGRPAPENGASGSNKTSLDSQPLGDEGAEAGKEG